MIAKKFVTGEYVGSAHCCTKFSANWCMTGGLNISSWIKQSTKTYWCQYLHEIAHNISTWLRCYYCTLIFTKYFGDKYFDAGRAMCNFNVSSSLFSDPCPGVPSIYTWNTHVKVCYLFFISSFFLFFLINYILCNCYNHFNVMVFVCFFFLCISCDHI